MKKNLQRLLNFGMIAIVAVAGSVMAVRYLSFLAVLENQAADIRIAALQPPLAQSTDVVVIAIDEVTLGQFPYRSPIDRGFLADLIATLSAKGAKVIGVDVILDQPTEPEKDARLKAVIAENQTPIFFSYSSTPSIVNDEQLAYLNAFVPIDKRAEANLLTDPFDGTVRWINPGGETGRQPPGFVRKAAALAGVPAPKTITEIAWRGRPDADTPPIPIYPAMSAAMLPDAWFKDRIVLVGAVLSITDRHRTPLAIIDDGDQGMMPGVIIQAHGLTQILESRRPPRMPLVWIAGLSGLFATLGILISILKRGIAFNLMLGAVITAAYWVGAFLGYGEGLPMLPVVAPTIAFTLSIWMMDVLIGRGERKQRQFMQNTFSRYVSPAVVNQLIADPEAADISGKRREATFIFTDIAGFTTLSEILTSDQLSQTLNDYLDGACAIILKYEGTIDKFIGDAIMAIFNAPIEQSDHVERAVRCALELDLYAESFRKDRNQAGIPIGVTRIGLHTGIATIGNFGSNDRMDFTALGDTVNTAARTEGVNKYFGTRICCTEDVVQRCTGLRFQSIGDIILKGKTHSLALYSPVPKAMKQEFLDEYEKAFLELRSENIAAIKLFSNIGNKYSPDPIVKFHLNRISRGLLSTKVIMDEK